MQLEAHGGFDLWKKFVVSASLRHIVSRGKAKRAKHLTSTSSRHLLLGWGWYRREYLRSLRVMVVAAVVRDL